MATQYDPIAKDGSLNTTEATPRNIADVLAEGLKGIEDALPPTYTEGDGIDISNDEISVDTTFTEASTRANIASGETFATILGKIKKFFTDLKTVAFTGAYSDLTGQPTIPTAASDITYDPTTSGLSATDAQGAIDEVNEKVETATEAAVETGAGTNIRVTFTKIGRVVYAKFWNGMYTASAGAALVTIPDGYIPINSFDFMDSYSQKRIRSSDVAGHENEVVCGEALSGTAIRGTVCYLCR